MDYFNMKLILCWQCAQSGVFKMCQKPTCPTRDWTAEKYWKATPTSVRGTSPREPRPGRTPALRTLPLHCSCMNLNGSASSLAGRVTFQTHSLMRASVRIWSNVYFAQLWRTRVEKRGKIKQIKWPPGGLG